MKLRQSRRFLLLVSVLLLLPFTCAKPETAPVLDSVTVPVSNTNDPTDSLTLYIVQAPGVDTLTILTQYRSLGRQQWESIIKLSDRDGSDSGVVVAVIQTPPDWHELIRSTTVTLTDVLYVWNLWRPFR